MNMASRSKEIKLGYGPWAEGGREEHLFSPREEDEDPSEGGGDQEWQWFAGQQWDKHLRSSLSCLLPSQVSDPAYIWLTSVPEQAIYPQQSRYFGFQMWESAGELIKMKFTVVPQLRATAFIKDKPQEGEINLSIGPFPHRWLKIPHQRCEVSPSSFVISSFPLRRKQHVAGSALMQSQFSPNTAPPASLNSWDPTALVLTNLLTHLNTKQMPSHSQWQLGEPVAFWCQAV